MNMTHASTALRGLAAAMALGVALTSGAVPAKPGPLTYTQPDGTTVQIRLSGDEHAHTYTSADGYVLIPSADGSLTYATLDSRGQIRSTGFRCSDVERRSAAELHLLGSIDRAAVTRAAEAAETASRRSAAARRSPARITTGPVTKYPTTGSPKGLVLLVEFQDVKFRTEEPQQAFTALIKEEGYSHNGATGSALDYFRDNSGGRFTPDIDVYGPVTLPQTEPYYGSAGAQSYDAQAWLMARDGIVALREQHPEIDFSQYDNDGDGEVDYIFIFYAGYGQNEGAPDWTIWPHAAKLWDFYGIDCSYNGVRFNDYACTNELQGNRGTVRTGIGTFVHEYSHILGLMDIYPTRLAGSAREVSCGSYDVMDSGSYNNHGNTPPCFSAFERYSLGWLSPRKLTGPENIILDPLHTTNTALLIDTEKPEEFFLLENRQREGWDSYIEGHGMLVWHIDYLADAWKDNVVNNEFSHQRVDIIEADGVYGDASRAGDPFPGTSSVRSLTATSTPAMTTWIGVDPEMPITDIYEIDGRITFRVKGGGDALPVPVADAATAVTPTGFTANWQLVPGISDYELDICAGTSPIPLATHRLSGATSYAVSGLEPSTLYTYVVRSCDGTRTSADSERISVTTAAPTLDMLSPVATPATDITADSFTATWQAMEGAAGYRLDVYTKKPIAPTAETADFTDGVKLPDGWSTNCNTTGSLSGYYGEGAPSLRMMYDSDRVVTADYPGGINSLSFWYRGNSTDADAALSVESLRGGAWQPVLNIDSPVKTAPGETVTIGSDRMPAGTTQLRIVFHRGSKGSLYIDDIKLEHDASFEPVYVDGFRHADCGASLSARVTGLAEQTNYFYTVRAYDNSGLESLPSAEIVLSTASIAGIDDVAAAGAAIGTADGYITVQAASQPTLVTIAAADGRIIYTQTVAAGAFIAIPAPHGVYIVKAGEHTAKLAL